MLFNSFIFVGLVLVTLALYYTPVLAKFQVPVLIAASLVFYSYNQPVLLLVLLLSVSINIVSSYYVVYGDPRRRKLSAVLGVALNLGVLCFFKYSPLFARTFFKPTDSVGEFLMSIPLPIGISFFTFQGISLVVDVYTGKYFSAREVVRASFVSHAVRVLFFKSFFPQLVSGPIVKAHDFMPQVGPKRFADIDWTACFKSLVTGYFLKMVVADNLKEFTFWIAYPYFQKRSTLTLIAMLFGFSCQIFADFAGYSLIAIGLARLFGYRFRDNFNFPYISTSFREFWKRWHISLSSFLMEYLYIPLGGNRKGKVRTYVNLMATMFLGGLWHGAAWSYAVWGTAHGAALAVERFVKDTFTVRGNAVTRVLGGVTVFSFVSFAWLLFKLPNFGHVIEYVKSMAANISLPNSKPAIAYVILYSLPVVVYHGMHLLGGTAISRAVRRMEYAVYGTLLFLILVNSGSPGAFIYFQF